MPKKVQQKVVSATWPKNVTTLGIDIGGSGVKASVLDAEGQMVTARVRQDTPYPCPPKLLVATIDEVVSNLPKTDRVSVGFPGLVRNGVVVHVPSLSRLEYGGSEDAGMAAQWHGFDLAGALSEQFRLPTKVVNDADMQGCAVAQGEGFEFVMTLGTGVGTALFNDGKLLDHLELSHGPFQDSTFDLVLGNAGRKSIGKKKWRKLVLEAIHWFDEMLFFDTIYVGGGNAKHLDQSTLPDKAVVVPNSAGITGGVRVWDLAP
mgnify:FL=1